MLHRLPESWENVLIKELEKPYFSEMLQQVRNEYAQYTCYPPIDSIFAAFEACPFENVKVVIIGQDPYHGVGQANGLAFSVSEICAPPPSLLNIFKEINTDFDDDIKRSGDLTYWARQGVLLLNATLTVREAVPGSHQKIGWECFTDAIISLISEKKEHVVFMLWGNFAKQKGRKIDRSRHLVLDSGHPSPLSANRKLWFGNRHFSRANQYLTANGKKGINW